MARATGFGNSPSNYKAVRSKRKFKKIVEAAAKTLISAGLAMQDFLTDLTIARTGVWQPSKAWTYYNKVDERRKT